MAGFMLKTSGLAATKGVWLQTKKRLPRKGAGMGAVQAQPVAFGLGYGFGRLPVFYGWRCKKCLFVQVVYRLKCIRGVVE